MKRLAFFLWCLCVVSSAHSLTTEELDGYCKRLRGPAWVLAGDTEAESLARAYLDTAQLPNTTPVVCLGPANPAELFFAEGYERAVSGKAYLFVMINADVRLLLFEEIRGIMAHEVAHLVTPRGRLCGPLLKSGKHEEFVMCEHEVDKEGDRLAGKGQVARTLALTIRYAESVFGSHDEGINEVLRDMRRRIFLLR